MYETQEILRSKVVWMLFGMLGLAIGIIILHESIEPPVVPDPYVTGQSSMTPAVTSATTTDPATSTSASAFSGPYELGFWVWGSPQEFPEAQMKSLIAGAKANGATVLYVTIDDYLAILAEKDVTVRDANKKAFTEGITRFITLAHAQGIAVDAESGDRDWIHPENRASAWALLEFIKEYNRTHRATFRNFQYDVESYLIPEYENDKVGVLSRYVSFIDETVTHMRGMDTGLSVVIPHFYDAEQDWTPEIAYGGQRKHTFSFVLELLDRRPNSSIIIMAYRDHADGEDGSIALSLPEINEASASPHTTKIIVAQETGNVAPDYTTFYGQSKESLFEQVARIIGFFRNKSAFGGIAIDYIDPFLKLP